MIFATLLQLQQYPMLQGALPPTNPEAMITAAVAAAKAEQAAINASMLAVITLAVMVLVLVVGLILLYKVESLATICAAVVKQTNGMHDTLMSATRALALIEGNVTGRAEQKKEDSAAEAAEATKKATKAKLASTEK
jgi:hypothetical protein